MLLVLLSLLCACASHLLSFSCAHVADDAPPRSTASRRRLSMATAGAGAGAGQPAAAPANGGVTGGMLCCVGGGPYVGVVLVLRCHALWWLQCMVEGLTPACSAFAVRCCCCCCADTKRRRLSVIGGGAAAGGAQAATATPASSRYCVCCVVDATCKVPQGSQLTHGACLLLAAKHQAWSVDSCKHTRQPKGVCPLDGCVVVVVVLHIGKHSQLLLAACAARWLRCLACLSCMLPTPDLATTQ